MKCNMCKAVQATVSWQNPWGDLHVLCIECLPKMKAHYRGEEE